MTVRWGVLSTARINLLVLDDSAESEIARFVAVASRDRARAEAFARKKRLERAWGSYEELLEDAEVDAVYVSLPNELHVPWTLRALKAGKHVLCEKPLTRHPAEAEEAFDLAEGSGLILMEAFMYRHHPQTIRLGELVREGVVGELRVVRASFSFPATEPEDRKLFAGADGGSLMDVGCYCVNVGRFLAGEPDRVFAERVANENGLDVRFVAVLRHSEGVLTYFDCGIDIPSREELEVVGSEGTIAVRDPWHHLEPALEIRRAGRVERVEFEPGNAYRYEVENVSRAVLGETQPLLGRDDAVAQARALEALLRSAEHSAPVTLDPAVVAR